MSATPRTDPLHHYRGQFDAVRGSLPGADAARAAAFARFLELGFPDAREEAWKYTSLRRLEGRSFVAATRASASTLSAPLPAAIGAPRIVLVNGYSRPDLSDTASLPNGVRLRYAADVAGVPALVARTAKIPAGGGTERFGALNAALTTDPVLIDVEAGSADDAVLHVACITTGDEPAMSHPRLSLRLESGSRLRVVLEHVGDELAERWVNAVVDIELSPGASLSLYRLQRQGGRTFHIERMDADVAADATLVVRDASLGATMARLDLNVSLTGPGASTELSGVFLADGSRHLDTHVRVDHRAANTTSVQDYRGIAAGRGRGVFNTKVMVHPGAQKSNARQTSRNLLLTAGAEIDTKPELEIYADDVQCGHGATTGQLDASALFYLRSRGLSFGEARRVLTRAFARAVLTRMDLASFANAVHEEFDDRLDRLLEAVA